MGFLLGVTQGLALIISVGFLAYMVFIVMSFLRYQPQPPGDPDAFGWHFLVPCRDEQSVIGDTIAYLRTTFPDTHVWVVDDASVDATADIIDRITADDSLVHLVRRVLPHARTGKGHALNAGYHALCAWLGDTADRERTILVVIDADGRLAPDCLAVCAGAQLFADPAVGGVQIDVWMSDRHDRAPYPAGSWWANALGRTLVRLQDMEFRAAIAAIQMARRITGSVGLGGNGQFTRLSALDDVTRGTDGPWRGSLLEDFEIGVHLLLAGYRVEYTRDTHVAQEGLPSLRRLLTQRTRWGQGTMQCIRYLPQIWRSPYISSAGAAELLYYLLQPWLQLLGSLVYPVPWLLLGFKTILEPSTVAAWFLYGPGWLLFTIYGTFGLIPFIMWGPMYRRQCEPQLSRRSAIRLGLAYALYVYTFYITSWRAATRMLTGRRDWSKTRRNAELATEPTPVTIEAEELQSSHSF